MATEAIWVMKTGGQAPHFDGLTFIHTTLVKGQTLSMAFAFRNQGAIRSPGPGAIRIVSQHRHQRPGIGADVAIDQSQQRW